MEQFETKSREKFISSILDSEVFIEFTGEFKKGEVSWDLDSNFYEDPLEITEQWVNYSDEEEYVDTPEWYTCKYYFYSVTVDKTYKNSADLPFLWDNRYKKKIDDLSNDLLKEVENNLAFRNSKWETLDYLNTLVADLKDLLNLFDIRRSEISGLIV